MVEGRGRGCWGRRERQRVGEGEMEGQRLIEHPPEIPLSGFVTHRAPRVGGKQLYHSLLLLFATDFFPNIFIQREVVSLSLTSFIIEEIS